MRPIALAMLAVLLVLGCTEKRTDFTVETRDGVPHAINRGWNVWSDSAAAPIQFALEQTYGTNEGSGADLLGNIRGMAVDSNGSVYVLDSENHRLVTFTSNGRVEWSSGREGKGPGEFHRPRGMTMTNSRLFVADQSGRVFDVWSTDGEFLEQHSFEDTDLSFLRLVGFAENYLIVSETGFGDDPQTIHALNPTTWKIAHSFPLKLNLDLPDGLATSAPLSTTHDSIYAGHVSEYVMRQFSIDGTLGRLISRKSDFLIGPGVYTSGQSRGISVYSGLHAPVRLPNGWYLVQAFSATNIDDPDAHARRRRKNTANDPEYAVLLDLFRPSGRYVGSLRWNRRRTSPLGKPSVVGPNGKLYTTTTDPFPQVRRYDVSIAER